MRDCRWMKTLHPSRKSVGRWTVEEDKRLKVAVTLFGPKTWKQISRFVPGRTHVQCRERWVNSLNPSLNIAEWTEEEDSKLEMAIEEHGYCWSKVAACVPRRTDNQCWRRWKALFPNEVPMLQAAKKIRNAALISNFVDRECERPALGPNDFVLPETYRITGSENVDTSKGKRRRSRRTKGPECDDRDAVSGGIFSEEVPRCSDANEVENSQGGSVSMKRRAKRSRSSTNNAGPSSSQSPDTRFSDANDVENLQGGSVSMKRRAKRSRSSTNNAGPSSSQSPDTVLLDMSNGADTRKSKTKPRLQKKRSSLKSNSVDGAPIAGDTCNEMIAREPQKNEHEHSDPREECLVPTPGYLDVQCATAGAELGRHDATQSKKAAKLHRSRRNHGKMHKDAGQAAISKTRKEKIRAAATNDDPSPFPDSMSLMEAIREIKAMKRKRKTPETCSSIDCFSLPVDELSLRQLEIEPNQHCLSNTDNGLFHNLVDFTILSDREHGLQPKENALALMEMKENNTILTSCLVQSEADRIHGSSAEVGKSPMEAKNISQV
ncbi:hypothetical protein OROMI_033841 [Orobanche minor]